MNSSQVLFNDVRIRSDKCSIEYTRVSAYNHRVDRDRNVRWVVYCLWLVPVQWIPAD